MANKGLFITFEGCEGSGKTTQTKLLQEWFINNNINAINTREPGGTTTAEKIRQLILDSSIKLEISSQMLLHNVARIEHVTDVILPNLSQGKHVICDRFLDSTIAYQHYGHNLDLSIILEIHKKLINITPDITFILDIAFEQHSARLKKRGNTTDRYENLQQEFHEKVIAGFQDIANKNPERCHLIKSSESSADETHQTIIKLLENIIL
jgi:dTMP kinase